MKDTTATPPSSVTAKPTKSRKFSLDRISRKRRPDPVQAELSARRKQKIIKTLSGFQKTKTLLMTLFWIITSPITVGIIAPYISYTYGQMMLNATALSAAIFVHLWPTRTPPWRTLAWAYLTICVVGSILLSMNQGRVALTVATIIGWLVIIMRVGQTGRKLVGMYQDWRWMR